MECPVCISTVQAYITCPRCNKGVCNTCVLKMLNKKRNVCPLCREDITGAIPEEIWREVKVEEDDDGYVTTDEFDPDASHLKIRMGSQEIAFIKNDGKRREIFFDDGHRKVRIEYKNRKCYMFRADDPTPVPIYPLRSVCAIPSS